MELKNIEIAAINNALGELADEKLKGKLKFKLFKNKTKVEDAMKIVQQSLEGVKDDVEQKEILEETQNIDLDTFTYDELEDLPLSMRQIGALEKITKEEQ